MKVAFRAWDGVRMRDSFVVARPQFADCLGIMWDEKFAQKTYNLKQ